MQVCIFCICLYLRAEIFTNFEPKIQNLQILQDYIFQELQHFATSRNVLWSLILFSSLRLNFSLTCKLSTIYRVEFSQITPA